MSGSPGVSLPKVLPVRRLLQENSEAGGTRCATAGKCSRCSPRAAGHWTVRGEYVRAAASLSPCLSPLSRRCRSVSRRPPAVPGTRLRRRRRRQSADWSAAGGRTGGRAPIPAPPRPCRRHGRGTRAAAPRGRGWGRGRARREGPEGPEGRGRRRVGWVRARRPGAR